MDRPRSRLRPAIIGVTLAAVAFCMLMAWRANATTKYHLTLQSVTLPENDRPLSEWLKKDDNITNVVVTRSPEGIVIDYMNLNGDYELPQIPLTELGYSNVAAMKTNMVKPSLAGVPLFACYGGLAIVLVLIGAAVSSFTDRLQSSPRFHATVPDA